MRLLFWREPADAEPAAPPTPYDQWLLYGRFGAWLAALLLLAVSLVPLGADWSARNEGGDINLTTEFYTAFENGGGFLTWDFAPGVAKELRKRVDALGVQDGIVSDSEFFVYQQGVVGTVRGLLVVRNFEIGGARMDEWRGFNGLAVNDSQGAHLHLTISGRWTGHDAEISFVGGALVTAAFSNLTGAETIHERTILINGGLATLTPSSGPARLVRVPGGAVVVSTHTYPASELNLSHAPDVRFVRFSALESSLVLLAPLAIALFVGLFGARREQEATRQPRVVPLHRALTAAFVLLLVIYFGGYPGAIVWGGGLALGIGGLLLAYKFYPADRKPEGDDAIMAAAKRRGRRGAEGDEGEWQPASDPPPSASAEDIAKAAAMLARAHTPLDTPDAAAKLPPAAPPGLKEARSMLPQAVSPLDLPDGETPRPGGREAPPPTPKPPRPVAPAPSKALSPAPAGPPTVRVRCPGCKHYFEAQGTRPLSVTCPHCGRRGVLR